MATTEDFIRFVADQVADAGIVRYRKMFGEYMVYVNDRPVLLVCNSTVYVKKHEVVNEIMKDAQTGVPYTGAKEHYILDVEDTPLALEAIAALVAVTPIPVKKKKKA